MLVFAKPESFITVLHKQCENEPDELRLWQALIAVGIAGLKQLTLMDEVVSLLQQEKRCEVSLTSQCDGC